MLASWKSERVGRVGECEEWASGGVRPIFLFTLISVDLKQQFLGLFFGKNNQ